MIPNTPATADVAAVEGPYWSYKSANSEARKDRDAWARVSARALLDGDLDRARVCAEHYALLDSRVQRLGERWDAVHDDPFRWIGFFGHDWSDS